MKILSAFLPSMTAGVAAISLLLTLASTANAQSVPPWNPGALPTAETWNKYFANKQDLNGGINTLPVCADPCTVTPVPTGQPYINSSGFVVIAQ